MKIKLLLIGKEDAGIFNSAISYYIKKLKFYVPFEVVTIPYLKNSQSLSADEQKNKEGDMILKKIEPSDVVVLLDEKGKEFSSVEYSHFLQDQMNKGIRNLVFVVGGPYGFSDEVYKKGFPKVSLSRMTFSHVMIRLVFVEQLYRAFTILKGEPYHHE